VTGKSAPEASAPSGEPHKGVTEGATASSARGVTNDPRDISIYLVRTLKGDSLEQIGKHFQIEKYSTVGSAIAREKKIKNICLLLKKSRDDKDA